VQYSAPVEDHILQLDRSIADETSAFLTEKFLQSRSSDPH